MPGWKMPKQIRGEVKVIIVGDLIKSIPVC